MNVKTLERDLQRVSKNKLCGGNPAYFFARVKENIQGNISHIDDNLVSEILEIRKQGKI